MSKFRYVAMLIPADETKDEGEDVEVKEKPTKSQSELKGRKPFSHHGNGIDKSSEPAKKKRKVVVDDSEEEVVASASIPSPPKSTKSSPSSGKKRGASPSTSKKAAAIAEDATPSAEESDSGSVDEEPELDAKTTKKSAETMYSMRLLITNSSMNWKPSKTSWEPNAPVPYSALCAAFDTISGTTKRLEILSHLTKFYRTVIEITPSNLLQCVYLTINRIAPDYEGLELGIGESLLVKAIAESSGRSVAQVKSELEKTGDLGDIAQVLPTPISS